MTLDFHIYNESGRVWIPATGDVVDVAPHLSGETFVVHADPLSLRETLWKVTHVETGCLASIFPWDAHTREEAIESARGRLAKVDAEKWTKVMEKTVRLMAGSPERPGAVPREPINEVR